MKYALIKNISGFVVSFDDQVYIYIDGVDVNVHNDIDLI